MKLYPLRFGSRLESNIKKLSRKLSMEVLVTKASTLNKLIIIANGMPDDLALSVISFHLNGEEIVGVVKPEGRTGLGAFEFISSYLKENPNITKMMVLLDQEDLKLKDIFKQAQDRIEKQHIQISNVEGKKRLKVYKCIFANKEFELIMSINGLTEMPVEKHSIEDHLLKAAMSLEIIKVEEELKDSKRSWNSLEESQRDEIFRKLKESSKLTKEIFPQQVRGCEYLRSSF